MAVAPLKTHRRIDVHHHFFPFGLPPDEVARIGWQLPADHAPWAPEISLKAMDMLGITTAVLSLPECVPAEKAREINIHSSSIRDKYRGRFEFFATMPTLSDTKAVLGEIAYALDILHAIGVALPSSFGHGTDAKYIGHDVCDPMWEELDRRGAVVFLHGGQTPSSTPYPHALLGLPITEVPNETYKAAAHLVVTGKKRRYPNVKIILSHLGGSTPFLAPRVAVLSNYMGCPLSRDEILQDFKSFYYETALSGYETTLTAIQSFVEPDHLLFGSDFPAVTTEMAGWYAKNVEEFYAGDQMHLEALMSKNALRLMPSLKAY